MATACKDERQDAASAACAPSAGRIRRSSYRACAAIFATVLAASGANCQNMLQQYTQPLPRALPASASLQQIIDVVNDNSSRVQSLYAPGSSLSAQGFSLRSDIAFQRPRNFRIKGVHSFTGPELDLGSNDEIFWFWLRRNQPPAVLFCRHDQFATSAARQALPVEPEWLIQALGVVSFGPDQQHQGPQPVGSGRLRITSTPFTPGGNTRITIIDESRGVVLEENMYNSQGVLLASAQLSRHARDLASGVILPRHAEIQLPPAQLQIKVDLNNVQINTLSGLSAAELWVKPSIPGYNDLDLANPNLQLPPGGGLSRIPPVGIRY